MSHLIWMYAICRLNILKDAAWKKHFLFFILFAHVIFLSFFFSRWFKSKAASSVQTHLNELETHFSCLSDKT